MTRHQHILDVARHTKRTLYVITAVYVGIGFFLAVPAALSGDRLSTFLGFLIISGALGAAVVVGAVLRLMTRLSAVTETLDDIRDRFERIERATGSGRTADAKPPGTSLIDLAAFGKGDPNVLAAASLGDVFPRLVTTMEEKPPAEPVDPESDASQRNNSDGGSAHEGDAERQHLSTVTSGITTRNLLREWRLGLSNGDLGACRAVYAALVEMADPADLTPLKEQIDQLADRTEAMLREAFSKCAADRDYAGMLSVGEKICRLLPNRPVAGEFKRLKSHLLRRCEQPPESAEAPTLRVVR